MTIQRLASKSTVAVLLALAGLALAGIACAQAPAARSMADILAASQPSDWRPLDPENTVYLELASGRVVIELAPAFAPRHIANLRALARAGYFDGLAIMRVQENYVVQWGDADGKRPVKGGVRSVPAEFTAAWTPAIPFTRLPDVDGYAPEVGFSASLPAARDPKAGRTWLAHCYGMVGAGRDLDADSGGGTELYVVIGHAPRHLDRNVTLLGRVLSGMELLTTLPRGTAAMGFHEKPEQRVPLVGMKLAADLPPAQRSNLEVLRSDTTLFAELVESRRNRRDEWYKVPAGHIELCNVPLPVRQAAP